MAANVERCIRCRGRMVQERDWAGSYLTCMACGHVLDNAGLDPRFGTAGPAGRS